MKRLTQDEGFQGFSSGNPPRHGDLSHPGAPPSLLGRGRGHALGVRARLRDEALQELRLAGGSGAFRRRLRQGGPRRRRASPPPLAAASGPGAPGGEERFGLEGLISSGFAPPGRGNDRAWNYRYFSSSSG